jgi:hypothetical protein
LAAVLDMNERSATNNVLRPLKRAGLVDQENKPTKRSIRWRDDDQYPQVCEEIRKEVYPQELLDAFSGPNVDRSAVERWFRNNARVGENAARKMARFYLLLVEADPSKQNGSSEPKTRPQKPNKTRSKAGADSNKDPKEPQKNTEETPIRSPPENTLGGNSGISSGPSLHIDVQVHISPEATPEQIETIFASMARHLYKNDGA